MLGNKKTQQNSVFNTFYCIIQNYKTMEEKELTNLKKTLKTEPCNVEQHVELSEVIVLSLFEEISPGNVFSEEIFLWIYVFLSPFHDLKQIFLKLLVFLALLNSSHEINTTSNISKIPR